MPIIGDEGAMELIENVKVERLEDCVLVDVEWPGRPGPFAWRLVDGGLALRGRYDEWFIPIARMDRSMEIYIAMTYENYQGPEYKWGVLRSVHIGSVYPDTPTDGVWRGGESLWGGGPVGEPRRDGAPCARVLSWLPNKEGNILMACPPFDKPYPFTATLDPEGGWIVLKSEAGEKACLDLVDGNGECRRFGGAGWFEKALLVLDWLRDQVPPWSTGIIVPEGWDQRASAARWAPGSALAKAYEAARKG